VRFKLSVFGLIFFGSPYIDLYSKDAIHDATGIGGIGR